MAEIVLGYIYILTTSCYGKKVKLGSTRDISRRKWDYFTYIPKDVKYYNYFEILDYGVFSEEKTPLISIEKNLYKNKWFHKRRYLKNKEFFSTKNTDLIEYSNNIKYVMDNFNVKFRVVEEDTFFDRPKREKSKEWKEAKCIDVTVETHKNLENYILRDYQEKCVDLMRDNLLGKFILPTGAGKTVIFLQYLSTLKKSLVLVPFIELINQISEKSRYFSFGQVIKISEGRKSVINRKNGHDNVLYISTYQSSIKEKYEFLKEKFDCIVFDECHYTVLNKENKHSTFQYMIDNGKSDQRFFFTATEKNIRIKNNIDKRKEGENKKKEKCVEEIYSMDNEMIYGPILYRLFLDDAIKDGILTDYNINFWLFKDKLKCLEKIIKTKIGKKIMIFCANLANLNLVKKHLETIENINVAKITGKTDNDKKREKLKNFREFNGISILVLCKMLSVGFDEPMVDTTLHYDRCNSSIDFMQKNGRSSRIYPGKNRSNIIILTNIEDNDRDIKYYKSLINTIYTYDRRIEDKIKSLKECKERGIYNSISFDCENEEIYNTVYDRYLNYISGYGKKEIIREKFKKLIEFYKEYKRWPKRSEKYTDKYKILGSFPRKIKQDFINPLTENKPPILYPEYQEEFIEKFKEIGIWKTLINKKVKRIVQELSIPEKFDKLVEFIERENKYPSSDECKKYDLKSLPGDIRKKIITPMKKREPPKGYPEYRDGFIKKFKEIGIWETLMEEKPEKPKIPTIHDRFDSLIEYISIIGGYPKRGERYKLMGNFASELKTYFINPIRLTGIPRKYSEFQEEFTERLKEVGVWEELMNGRLIKKLTLPMSEKIDRLAEFIEKEGRYPRNNENQDYLGTFPQILKTDFLYPLRDTGQFAKKFDEYFDEIMEKLEKVNIWTILSEIKWC